ncbi:MAG: DUF1080 domain-containing protein [Oceanicoccus sp.]
MRRLFPLLLILFTGSAISQIKDPKATEVWEPVPEKISTGEIGSAPSDAIILFNGSNLDQWKGKQKDSDAAWKVENGYMEVVRGSGAIQTREKFGDIQLHIEWSSPTEIVSEGQGRGNSGIFLQQRYELQVLDSYDNSTYANGQAGAIYKQTIPLVNATVAPGQWNIYDIIYRAPVFNGDGIKVRSAYITVLHNGVLIQNHTEISGTTEYIGLPTNKAHGKDSIELQDHFNPVRYRNIWVRPL